MYFFVYCMRLAINKIEKENEATHIDMRYELLLPPLHRSWT